MSSFTGKFREYPTISADNFEKENHDSLAFFLSHCHKDHMSGLDSAAIHQRFMTSKGVFLYCSETTENLLMCDTSYSHLKDYIRSIPLEQQTIIPLIGDRTEEQSSICVTLLPAGHCVGSVMFLFEGPHGNVLYTGDFRLAKGDVKRISFFHANGRIKDIKSIYIDTTFCLPKMNFLPSREQSRDAIIELIDKWFSRGPECAVSLLCKGMYGFEYLLKEVAMKYKTKIHVSAERLAMYKYLPDMTPYFTTDGQSTRIHSCKWQTKRSCDSDLPCGSMIHPSVRTKVLRIKPTTMWVARGTKPMPADFKRYDKEQKLWRVVHSMHASMEEIQDLVGYLRPYHVYPNVPPAGLDTLADAFERLTGLTRLQECDSCNQDESGEERFQEHAAQHLADGFADNEQKVEEKAAMIKLLEVPRPVPDEKVLAKCKELGLDEDESLAPAPKRRRPRNTVVVMEEKKSTGLQHSKGTSSNDVINQQQEKTEAFCTATASEDRPSGETVLQFKKNVRSPCKTELESLNEGKKDYINASRQPTCRRKHLNPNSPGNSLEGTLEGYSNGFSENNCDNFTDRKTTSSCSVSSERILSMEEKSSQGSYGEEVSHFDVPPSPGHVEPLPDNLSRMHRLLQNGEPLSITKMLKF